MLEFRNLRADYGGAEVLHGVSAALRPGCLTAIIGPNGCGKTTLLKCAAGLMKPSQGEILLDGKSLYSLPDRERARHISYMPQNRIVPDASVEQLAAHGRYPHLKWGQALRPADREITAAAIRRTGLAPLAQRPVASLSGGERQRSYLSMMLAQQAQIMLLDEPTNNLDPSSRFELMELLHQLRSEGHCIAVVLHDLALALEYADEILMMQEGKLIAAGTPEAVYLSGRLQEVFGICVHQVCGGKYVFSPAGREGAQ